MLRNFLLVGLGGGIGSMLRYAVSLWPGSARFPYHTLFVNILGSFAIGLVMALGAKMVTAEHDWKLFLATGICGGFTTFSAFSMENIHLLQNGRYVTAMVYILISIAAGLTACWAGYKCFQ